MRAVAAVALLVAVVGCTADPPRADPRLAPETSASPAATGRAAGEPPWDPRDVDDLPAAADQVAPWLPDVIEVPASSPALAERPVETAVLTVREDDALQLLGTDGSWRSVPLGRESGSAELTADGTRLAVATETGVDIWDLPTGERTKLDNPAGFQAWEFVSWAWLDTTTLLLSDGSSGGWRVDAASGKSTHVPYPASGLGWWGTVDPGGVVVESADYGRPAQLTDWASGDPRRVDMRDIGRLATIRADVDTVVGTSYDNGPFAVYVADRSDLTPRDVLRVRDHEGNYSNGGLSVLALLADGTVLLRVAVFGKDFSWRLVAWDPSSGDLSLVTRGAAVLLSCATGLLG
jgi:hypothetical protein